MNAMIKQVLLGDPDWLARQLRMRLARLGCDYGERKYLVEHFLYLLCYTI
jgi:hypothetical protein